MLSHLPVQLAMVRLIRHGRTQTAVSVPMQIGAAFAALQAQGEAAAPLELQAAKSRLLHLEPAAGAAGLGMLTARLQQQPSHETLHLRAVNPHVAAIFQVSLQPALPLQMLLSLRELAQHYEQARLVLRAALILFLPSQLHPWTRCIIHWAPPPLMM